MVSPVSRNQHPVPSSALGATDKVRPQLRQQSIQAASSDSTHREDVMRQGHTEGLVEYQRRLQARKTKVDVKDIFARARSAAKAAASASARTLERKAYIRSNRIASKILEDYDGTLEQVPQYIRGNKEFQKEFDGQGGGYDQTDELMILAQLANLEEERKAAGQSVKFDPASFDKILQPYEAHSMALEAQLASYQVSFFKKKTPKQAKKYRRLYFWANTLSESEIQSPLTILYRFAKSKNRGLQDKNLDLKDTVYEELSDLSRAATAQLESEIATRNPRYLELARDGLYGVQDLRTMHRLVAEALSILIQTDFFLKKRKRKKKIRHNFKKSKEEQEQDKEYEKDPLDPARVSSLFSLLVIHLMKVNISGPIILEALNAYMREATGENVVDGVMEAPLLKRRLLFVGMIRQLMSLLNRNIYGVGEEGGTRYQQATMAIQRAYDFCVRTLEDTEEVEEEESSVVALFDEVPEFHISPDNQEEEANEGD